MKKEVPIINKKKKKVLTKKRNVVLKYVVTPGGYRLKSAAKRATKKKKISTVDGAALSKLKPSPILLIRKQFLVQPQTFINHLGLAVHDVHNPHWVAYGGWQNTNSNPVTSFVSSWIVPQPPPLVNRQIIYIFSGIQNDFQILQPVLQWGTSAAGGGTFWSVGSWFAAGQADPVKFSGLTRVNPGDKLTAVIQMTDQSNNRFSYSSFFSGIDRSRLDAHSIPELKYCCAVLETYNVNVIENYLNISQTPVSGMVVRDKNGPIMAGWQVPTGVGRFGEHAEVRRIPGSPDEIDLFY